MLLLIRHNYLPTSGFFFGEAVAFLRESYTFLERGSYISSINFGKLMFFEFDE